VRKAGTAHKLARMFYRLWTTRQAYTDPGADYYQQQYQERMVNNLKKKAHSLFSLNKNYTRVRLCA
jgi:hypothetical protein